MERQRTIYSVDKRGVAKLILNRPEKLNAFDTRMQAEIAATLDEVNADPGIKILIITGKGRYFATGLDVKEAQERMPEAGEQKLVWPRPAGAGDIRAAQVKKITIAALNGPAVGMSCDLALACDFRIMAESATLWEAYARLMPPSAGTWFLPRMIGLQRAMEMLLLGEPIDAKKALEWGLVYRVVPDDQLEAATEELVQKVLKYSPAVMQFAKSSILGGLNKNLVDAMDYISWTRYAAENLGISKEAARAIAEKRQPKYPA
jgi:2-(1,2-epoxy-1,2-dihydrophenyl)acetyl-CoA isomerase